MKQTESLTQITDAELVRRTQKLATRERANTALLVAHLAEVDHRKLYLGAGCASLFTYCVEVLRLSESAAYKRIAAARAVRRFPGVLEFLSDGRVHLTAITRLAPHFTESSHQSLLRRATHKRKHEIERLVAEVAPRPPVSTVVRRMPLAAINKDGRPALETTLGDRTSDRRADASPDQPSHADQAKQLSELGKPTQPKQSGQPSQPEPAPGIWARPRPNTVEALSLRTYRVQFTADSETVDLLRRAQDLMRHQVPDGNLNLVLKRGLVELVRLLEQQKCATRRGPSRRADPHGSEYAGKVNNESALNPVESRGSESMAKPAKPARPAKPAAKPAGKPAKPGNSRVSRYIPARVRRAVWKRDLGRCAFVGAGGRRCTETGMIEYHHVRPYAQGGKATVRNIQLRCRSHNGYEAALIFGDRVGEAPTAYVASPCGMNQKKTGSSPRSPPSRFPRQFEFAIRSGSSSYP